MEAKLPANARGPKKTPTRLLRLTGSHRANGRDDDLAVEAEAVAAPAWLSSNAKGVFGQLATVLLERGLMTGADQEALAILAQAIVEHRDLCKDLDSEGYTVETAEKGVKTNPLVTVRQQAWARIKNGMAQFGLSPADRAGLKISPAESKTPKKAIGLGGAS